MNKFARFLLILTALAPVALTVGVNRWSQHGDNVSAACWIGSCICCVVLCILLLRHIARNNQTQQLDIASFERDNRSVIDFLLVYLLPLVYGKDLRFEGDYWTLGVVVFFIAIVLMHKAAFEINPVLGLLGYHFYTVQIFEGFTAVLISKKDLPRRKTQIETVELAPGLYLQTEK